MVITSPSAPAAPSKPGHWVGIWGGSFAKNRMIWCLFSPGKHSAPMENISGNTPAQGEVHCPGQWHPAWQGHRWCLGYIHAVCLSPPTATYSEQQGSFPPFKVPRMWLEGLRLKGKYRPVSSHPPAPYRGPGPGTTPGSLPPPRVAVPAHVFVSHSPTGSSCKNLCNHFLSHYDSWAPFGQ